MYLLKPIECTTSRVNPNINYGFGVIIHVSVSSMTVKDLILYYSGSGRSQWRRLYVCWNKGYRGISLYLLINSAVNLKLL